MHQSTCTVANCDRPIQNKTHGYCDPHYKRYWRHGDVQADVPIPPKRAAPKPVEDFEDGTRMCQTCDERKSLADFHIDRSSPLGRKTSCRSCRTKVESARHYQDRERITQRMREYRAQNLEAARARGAASYRRNKDKNIAAAIAGAHVRRARMREQPYEPGITVPALRKRDGDTCHYCSQGMVFGRYRAGERPALMATLEHVRPISRGGSHTWDNCVLACWRCNSSRGNRAWTPTDDEADRERSTGLAS